MEMRITEVWGRFCLFPVGNLGSATSCVSHSSSRKEQIGLGYPGWQHPTLVGLLDRLPEHHASQQEVDLMKSFLLSTVGSVILIFFSFLYSKLMF